MSLGRLVRRFQFGCQFSPHSLDAIYANKEACLTRICDASKRFFLESPPHSPPRLRNLQGWPLDTRIPVWNRKFSMSVSENHFSLSRAASIASGRARKQHPIVFSATERI